MHKLFNKENALLRIIAFSYIAMIILGSALLMLPVSTFGKIKYIDALFTSASATCVTGLSVFDIGLKFTLFGQLVILILIQIGGIGFMTVASAFLMLAGKRIGLWSRGALKESISAFQIGGIVRLIKRVVIATVVFETLGAIMLAIRFCPQFGLKVGLYYSFFHSISAFCNAGFDLVGGVLGGGSLVYYQGDVLVNLTITALIIVGGIGFIVWDDIFENKLRFKKYKLHSKIVLISTAALLIFGTVSFYLFEAQNALLYKSGGQKWLISFFQSVSPRTAGFTTVDMSSLSGGGTFLTLLLMLIGASPGSTGGGVKTTTVVIILISIFSYLKNQSDVNVFKRRLERDALKKALSTFAVYLLFIIAGTFVILLSQNLPLGSVVFETVSAIGTVGLTDGITALLNSLSKAVIITLMFCGRLGSLTVASIFAKGFDQKINSRLPEEKVIIG